MKSTFLNSCTQLIVAVLFSTRAAGLLAVDRVVTPALPKASLSPILAAEAWRMTEDFPESHYSHKTSIDVQRGVCDVDCSGFVVAILKQKSPAHLDSIVTKHKRPLAEDFYATFGAKGGKPARGWKRVDRLADAQAGDILAWIKVERMPGDNTGHVVLFAQKPLAESPRRYRVRVFDSTLHGHAHDDRTDEERSGIGSGTLWIEVDAEGRPSGYRWKSRTGQLHTAPIAVGRAVPIGL